MIYDAPALVTKRPKSSLDFGIATSLDMDPDRTATATPMTPAYAAPEQLRGEPVGVYTDVYALGVLLYEMLAERRPYDVTGRSPGEAEAQILTEAPAPPSTRAPAGRGLRKTDWADLDVVCLTAMQKEPDRRYASAEALVRDLDHFLAGEPIEARPDSARYRTGKFVRRNRTPVAVATAVLAAAVALVAFYTVRLASARDAALAEAAKAETVSEYLIGLFDASDPFAPGADSLTVEALLARGAARAEDLADQPEAQAQMLNAMGRVHLQLSQYGRADTLLRRALAIRRRPGGDPLDVAETLRNLGTLRDQQGEFDEGEAFLREALALSEAHLSPDHPDLAVVLNEFGSLLTNKAEYAEADSLYRRALQIQRAAYLGSHADVAHTLGNLGINAFNQGDYETAERHYREALDATRDVFGPDHPRVALALGPLAMIVEREGDFAAADSMMMEDLRIRRESLGDDHYYTAYGLLALGNLTRKMEDYERSEAYFREAIAINDGLLGPGHVHALVARNFLALTLRDRGDYRNAEPLLRQASEGFRQLFPEDHYYPASSACQLAEVRFLAGDARNAAARYAACLPNLTKSMPAGHPSVALQQNRFGEVLVALARYEQAEPLLRESYRHLYDRYGSEHEDVQTAADRLAALFEATGRPNAVAVARTVPAAAALPE